MYRKILVSTDGSELSFKAVKEAAQLAGALRAKLLVLHVRSPVDMPDHAQGGAMSRLGEEKIMEEIKVEERKLLDAAKKVATSTGITPEVAFIEGYVPHEAIIRVSREQECDLIVMGTHIHRGLSAFLYPSETRKVLEHTAIPVLVVR